MSTGVIIAIIIVAVVIVALLAFVMPRMRAAAAERKQQRELESRRERVVTESRDQAQARHERADLAERQARIAEQEATRARADAHLHEERAELHERGLADHELMDQGREGEAGTADAPSTGAVAEDRASRGDGAEFPVRERIVERDRTVSEQELADENRTRR
jgi:hypothetical protein